MSPEATPYTAINFSVRICLCRQNHRKSLSASAYADRTIGRININIKHIMVNIKSHTPDPVLL